VGLRGGTHDDFPHDKRSPKNEESTQKDGSSNYPVLKEPLWGDLIVLVVLIAIDAGKYEITD